MMEELTKTSRILSVYHLFLNCQEVSFQELKQQFEVSEKTSLRDIRLLERRKTRPGGNTWNGSGGCAFS